MSSPSSENMEQLLDRFDEAWSGPAPPRIEDYLPPPGSSGYLPLLLELVQLDREWRFKRGENPRLEEYCRRFPICSDALTDWLTKEQPAAAKKETEDPRVLPTLDAPPLPSPFRTPARRIGEYDVLESLGSGGVGEVYKARHRRLDKLVALKLLSTSSQSSREMVARFRREMKAVGALVHPNVVEAHDAGEQSGVVYLAMKLIEGIDLERLIKELGPLPITEACELVRQAATGLHYLHKRGLVHRDVKPSNLMRTPDGTVKILDLGLARWCIEAEAGHDLTGTGRVMGTPDFLAPEQIEDAAVADAQSDLYGLGGTLFYLLTGRPPFADYKSLFSKLEAHRSAPPPDIRSLRSEVPSELADLVYRLLSKNPEERFPSAADVAAALAPYTGAASPLDSSALCTRKAISSKPIRLTFVAATAGTMLVAMILVLMSSQKPSEPPSSSHPADAPPESIQVQSLLVHLTRSGSNLPAGLLGVDVFDPHFGDTVTVDSRLTRAAYAFLIAFRPDGDVEVCFPEKEDELPPLTDKPRYPSTAASAGREYELTDGEGIHAFALVVSSKSLPTFKEWWSQVHRCPWGKEDGPGGVVYRANGDDPVEVLGKNGARAKGASVKGKTIVADLATWLRKTPGIETVQVLAFTVAPKEKN
jgi:serine/threonine protein kinase